jgi:molecular chaperone Hsp33
MKPIDEQLSILSPISDPGGDYLVRSTALNGAVRAIAVRSTQVCSRARDIHGLSPVATAAMGRFLTGVLLLTPDLEKKEDTITAIIRSDGPIEGMTVVGLSGGRVRGTIRQPVIPTTWSKPGKLDVGSAVGKGQLTIIRDLGLKEPYIGQTILVSG